MKYYLLAIFYLVHTVAGAQGFTKLYYQGKPVLFSSPVLFQNNIYFARGPQSGIGNGLWFTDGTTIDSVPGFNNYIQSELCVLDTAIYFSVYDTAYKVARYGSSGQVSYIKSSYPWSPYAIPGDYTALNHKLYYTNNVMKLGYSWQIIEYDPATDTTVAITNFPDCIAPSDIGQLIVYNNKICFVAYDLIKGYEIYEYDPTTKNIQQLTNLQNDTTRNAARMAGFTILNNKLYFMAGQSKFGKEKNDLFMYDGINPAVQLTDAKPGTTYTVPNGKHPMAAIDNYIYMQSKTWDGAELFVITRYDTITKTVSITDTVNRIATGTADFILYKQHIYFNGRPDKHNSLLSYCDKTSKARSASYQWDPVYTARNFIEYNGDLFMYAFNSGDTGTLYRFNDYMLQVNTVKTDIGLNIYPNPAQQNNGITVSAIFDKPVSPTVSIYNQQGILIRQWETKTTGTYQYHMPGGTLPAGSYILKLHYDGHDVARSFIVQ